MLRGTPRVVRTLHERLLKKDLCQPCLGIRHLLNKRAELVVSAKGKTAVMKFICILSKTHMLLCSLGQVSHVVRYLRSTLQRSQNPIQNIKQKSGANVQIDSNPSPVQDTKTVIIRGSRPQIEAAVRLINQTTGAKESFSTQAQKFWLQWVEAVFPDLDSRAYFLPPVYINRVPMTRESTADQDVLVLQPVPGQMGQSSQTSIQPSNQSSIHPSSQPLIAQSTGAQASIPQCIVQDSALRDDAAMQRVFLCLQTLSEQNGDIMFVLTQLQFGQYLGEPCYAAAAAQLPLAASLPPVLPRNWKRGDFDVLLIHRNFGFVVFEVKAVGDNTKELNMSQQEANNNVRKKMKQAVSQLDKAEAMLSYLVSDIAPGLRITKAIAVPNLTTCQVQQAISGDLQLTKDLCQCLGTSDPADITGLCLCSDQLSDPKTPWDVSSHVLRELEHWWQRRVAGAGPDGHMTSHVYRSLVGRFCGPATTVTVPCISPPRLKVKTLGQAVSFIGECYTAVITLFPEQVHLLHTAPPTLFVTGPPGTGKTVVLLLMAIQWLRCGQDVYIVSIWLESRAASIMLYHLLLQTVKTQQSTGVSPGQPHLLLYHLDDGKDLEKAVNDLSQAASGGSLYAIADETGNDERSYFKKFSYKLLTQVPCLHLWAASCFHGTAPAGWQVEYLTRPLRSPPAVVREVEQNRTITEFREICPYSERGVADHTDGPTVRRLYHRRESHSGLGLFNCATCGREVASFLHSLRVGVTENGTTTSATVISTSDGTTPPCLQWRDVLVLYWNRVSKKSGVVDGLKEAGIPVRVMEDDDIEDVATARSDVVWLVHGRHVQGLERKVVVCLKFNDDVINDRLYVMSRCTSQLVIVTPES